MFKRNTLLAHKHDWEFKPLGEIAYYPKRRVAASTLTASNYVGVENLLPNKQGKKFSECVPNEGNLIQFLKDDILVGNIRPYLKKIWRANADGGTNGDVLVFRIRNEFNAVISAKFLYYVLASEHFFAYSTQYAKGAKMPRGDKEKNLDFLIPVPPRAEQERIVAILDRFETLVNDLNVGLPAELAARRRQYEYYRDRLLTFQPLEQKP